MSEHRGPGTISRDVSYSEITDQHTGDVIGYQWNCQQCASGSGAAPSQEQAFWAGSAHRGTAHGTFEHVDRISEFVDDTIDRHPGLWIAVTILVTALVLVLLWGALV